MTNIKRIKSICSKLEHLWLNIPEQRFMQLIVTFLLTPEIELDVTKMYYMSDEQIEKHLTALLESIKLDESHD